MSWQNEMVRILRFMIGDVDATSYSDSRLEETLLVSAQLQADIDYQQDYTIDVDSLALTPDPTSSNPKDNWFITIVCTKAAAIILHSEAKTLAAQAYRIKDGPSSIDVSSVYQAIKKMADDMNDKLALAIMQYKAGDSVGAQAILTPYTQEYISSGVSVRNFEHFT